MKIFHLNFFSIVFILLVISAFVLVPSFIIQGLWNSIYASNIEDNLSIEVWQAALLWGALVTALYMSGIFQFKLNFKTLDSIDLDSIADPELRSEIEKLKTKMKQEEETKASSEESK